MSKVCCSYTFEQCMYLKIAANLACFSSVLHACIIIHIYRAYGILLHEVMSFGNQPYPGQSNQDVLQFVTGGGRLPRPDNCPRRM